jgi:hypothetical protein
MDPCQTAGGAPTRRRAAPALLAVLGLVAPAPALADEPGPCLAATGYVFLGSQGTVSLYGGAPVVLFTPGDPTAFCDPPHADQLEIGGPSGAALIEYLAGTGLALATGVVASPSATQGNRAFLTGSLIFAFRVVPDDPGATAPIEISIDSRHDFERVRTEVSGVGIAENSHEGFYTLRQLSPSGLAIGTSWSTQGLVPSEGGAFPLSVARTVPAGVPLFLEVSVSQQSFARGSFGAQAGSASAEISSTVTLAVGTGAPASVVFELEEKLGASPPQLGVVTVPVPAAGPAGGAALAGLWALRRRATAPDAPLS